MMPSTPLLLMSLSSAINPTPMLPPVLPLTTPLATSTHEDPMKGINKALALAHQLIAESGPVREPVSDPEPGPIHEDDREVFEMLDKRMAALQLQVQAIKQGFREMEGGSGEPDDS
jgi:hypothetical protein